MGQIYFAGSEKRMGTMSGSIFVPYVIASGFLGDGIQCRLALNSPGNGNDDDDDRSRGRPLLDLAKKGEQT